MFITYLAFEPLATSSNHSAFLVIPRFLYGVGGDLRGGAAVDISEQSQLDKLSGAVD